MGAVLPTHSLLVNDHWRSCAGLGWLIRISIAVRRSITRISDEFCRGLPGKVQFGRALEQPYAHIAS
jgi:hypothetical protein